MTPPPASDRTDRPAAPRKTFIVNVAGAVVKVMCTVAVLALGWVVAVSYRGLITSPAPATDERADPRDLAAWAPEGAWGEVGEWEYFGDTRDAFGPTRPDGRLLPIPDRASYVARRWAGDKPVTELVRVPSGRDAWRRHLTTNGWVVTETADGWRVRNATDAIRVDAVPDEPDVYLVTAIPRDTP